MMTMRQLFSTLLLTAILGAYTLPGTCQASRDSALIASVKGIQLKLGLSDQTASKIVAAKRTMILGLDSLGGTKSPGSANRGGAVSRIRQQYQAKLQSLLTAAQWTRYQQLESAARDSFYVRMKGQKTPVKELDKKINR